MATKREKLLRQCEIEEWEETLKRRDKREGKKVVPKPIPQGRGYDARYERCILHVKCQQKINPRAKKVNPYAACHTSVG